MYFECCDYDPWDSNVHVSEGKFFMMKCALVPVPVDHGKTLPLNQFCGFYCLT